MAAQRSVKRQAGIGLLLLLVLSGALVLVVILNLLPKQPTEQERERITAEALARAKEALIAYAVAHMDSTDHATVNVPGYLPCPVMADPASPGAEGQMANDCDAQGLTVVGLLPFKALGIEPLRDGYGECLWYAVSGSFKIGANGINDTGRAPMVNWDTQGQIRLLASDGVTVLAGAQPESLAAAVIIAPGRPRGQTRTANANAKQCQNSVADATRYLEQDASLTFGGEAIVGNTAAVATPWGISTFVNGRTSSIGGEPVINDRVLAVTPTEIFDAVVRRKDADLIGTPASPGMLRRLIVGVADCIAGYTIQNVDTSTTTPGKDRRMVWAAALGFGNLQDMLGSANYLDVVNQFAGRVPYRVSATGNRPGRASEFRFNAGCGAPMSWTPTLENWWEHWKDHFFYAASPQHAPETVSGYPVVNPNNVVCDTHCLQITGNGATQPYAGAVIFAGRRSATQSRSTLAERTNASNYLEGLNAASIPSGDLVYVANKSADPLKAPPIETDLVACIKFNDSGTTYDRVVTFCGE